MQCEGQKQMNTIIEHIHFLNVNLSVSYIDMRIFKCCNIQHQSHLNACAQIHANHDFVDSLIFQHFMILNMTHIEGLIE